MNVKNKFKTWLKTNSLVIILMDLIHYYLGYNFYPWVLSISSLLKKKKRKDKEICWCSSTYIVKQPNSFPVNVCHIVKHNLPESDGQNLCKVYFCSQFSCFNQMIMKSWSAHSWLETGWRLILYSHGQALTSQTVL